MATIELFETDSLPLCPHCGKELTSIGKLVKGAWERHIIYICPFCKKLLSIGNDTGFGS